MKKEKFILFIFFLVFVKYTFAEIPKDINLSEDVKIKDLKQQIIILEEKIDKLNKIKKLKQQEDINDLKIGLTFSGGGLKAYAHIGVLKVLEEENIKIDYITGSSIGSFIGALYSVGYSLEEIESFLDLITLDEYMNLGFEKYNLNLERKEFFKKYPLSLKYDNNLKISIPSGIKTTEEMYLNFKKYFIDFDNKDFDEFPIPIRIIATDLNTAEPVAFSKGDMSRAIVASMALPTMFEPVIIDGKYYLDGGIVLNLPVQDTFDMGADLVIAVNIGMVSQEETDPNILNIINKMSKLKGFSSDAEQSSKASILITPDMREYSILSSDKENMMLLGEKAARDQINLLKLLPKKSKENIENKKDIEKSLKTPNEIVFSKIFYETNLDTKELEIVKNFLEDLVNKKIDYEELELRISKINSLIFIKNTFFEIKENSLYIEIEKNLTNRIGVGLQYRSGLESSLNLGTKIYSPTFMGQHSHINLKLGEYLGVDVERFLSYGGDNRYGFKMEAKYNETPFQLYDGNQKSAIYKNGVSGIHGGTIFNLTNTTSFKSMFGLKYTSLNLKIGAPEFRKLNQSSFAYNWKFIFKYDFSDSFINPQKGLKIETSYEGEYGIKSDRKVNTFLGSINGYEPINPELTFFYGASFGLVTGKNINQNQYIKLGGSLNNFSDREIAFFGLGFHQKLSDKFATINLGIKYEIPYNLYLKTSINFLTLNEVEGFYLSNPRDKFFKNFNIGTGLTLGYPSNIFGPIEISFGRNWNNLKSNIFIITMGYQFD